MDLPFITVWCTASRRWCRRGSDSGCRISSRRVPGGRGPDTVVQAGTQIRAVGID